MEGLLAYVPKGTLTVMTDVLILSSLTLASLLIYLGVNKVFGRLYHSLSQWKDVHIRDITIQKYRLISSGHLTYILIRAAKLLRLAIILVMLYIYIMVLLRTIPQTRPIYEKVFGLLFDTFSYVFGAVLDYIPNLAVLVLIIAIAYYALRALGMLFAAVASGQVVIQGFYPDWAHPTYQIVRFIVIAFALAVGFPYLPGAESSAFRGVSIFLGALFTLGSTTAISNIMAGIILTYMRPFKPGDRVKIADTVGDVLERTLLVTRISTIKNIEVTIPNSLVLGSHVLNYSASAGEVGLIVNTAVTIGYDVPWRKVHALLIEAASATKHILEKPGPFVLQLSLEDFTVKYEVNAYTDQPHAMVGIYSELHQNIQDVFAREGVEIMSPAYQSYRDGNKSTVPLPPTIPPAAKGDKGGDKGGDEEC